MLKNILTKDKYHVFFVIFGLLVLVLFSLLDIKLGMNVFLGAILLFSLIIKDGKQLLKDWMPFIGLFYVYEILRANAYEINQSLGIGFNLFVEEIIKLESKIFFFLEDLPVVELQRLIKPDISNPLFFDYIIFIFYSVIFFAFWGSVGFVIWKYRNEYFTRYMWGLIAFSFASVLVFLMFPVAPPWYASEQGLIEPVQRLMWNFEFIEGQQLFSVDEIGKNLFAAVPSLHAGWPFYCSLWVVKIWGKRKSSIMIVPFIIAFATWYGAEHYIVDSIIAMIMATLFFILSAKWDRILSILKIHK